MRPALFLSLACALFAANRSFDLSGTIAPPHQATVTLYGTSTSFSAYTLADTGGRFRFNGLEPGTYTLAVFVPGRGEIRRTVDIGPSVANQKGRVELPIEFDEARATADPGTVSARDLSIPDRARKEYAAAQKVLGKRDAAKAIEHLKKAVEIAPGFAQAWNNLGTIAYHQRRYEDAEKCFRTGLTADPSAYEPLVNLGGVLINLNKLDEAYTYNLHATLRRPNDALANSQLGMTYAALGKLSLAEKYLLEACRLDPGHFSHPQLLLADIYIREKRFHDAADQLQAFVDHHPDYPTADKIRDAVARLRRAS